MRTEEEFKQPFESDDSPVRKAGLSLVTIETKMIQCPLRAKWLSEGGDPMEYARSFIPTIRRWSNATFIDGEAAKIFVISPFLSDSETYRKVKVLTESLWSLVSYVFFVLLCNATIYINVVRGKP